MVLVIDTSSARSGVAVLSPELAPLWEVVRDSGREFDLAAEVRRAVDVRELTSVAVARGPGSFTGLRLGAAYAVGLALGRGLRLRPFPSLELQRERAAGRATAVIEAGRGRVYFEDAAGRRGLAGPGELPRAEPAVGWLRSATAEGLRAAGVALLEDAVLRGFGEAAAAVVARSAEIGSDSLTLEYMQQFGALR
jgi:tRNA threonylcarbamoyl adenosine modification protein YeaZ